MALRTSMGLYGLARQSNFRDLLKGGAPCRKTGRQFVEFIEFV
jgi:hypothetical protein